jgi:hypothetical protein
LDRTATATGLLKSKSITESVRGSVSTLLPEMPQLS